MSCTFSSAYYGPLSALDFLSEVNLTIFLLRLCLLLIELIQVVIYTVFEPISST